MSCEKIKKVSAYHDQELALAEREIFERHLASCAECAKEFSRLKHMSNFVASARFSEKRREPFAWRANLDRQRVVRLAQMLTAAAAIVMLFCSASALFGKSKQNPVATSQSWERTALTQQFEPGPSVDTDDPVVQILLRERP